MQPPPPPDFDAPSSLQLPQQLPHTYQPFHVRHQQARPLTRTSTPHPSEAGSFATPSLPQQSPTPFPSAPYYTQTAYAPLQVQHRQAQLYSQQQAPYSAFEAQGVTGGGGRGEAGPPFQQQAYAQGQEYYTGEDTVGWSDPPVQDEAYSDTPYPHYGSQEHSPAFPPAPYAARYTAYSAYPSPYPTPSASSLSHASRVISSEHPSPVHYRDVYQPSPSFVAPAARALPPSHDSSSSSTFHYSSPYAAAPPPSFRLHSAPPLPAGPGPPIPLHSRAAVTDANAVAGPSGHSSRALEDDRQQQQQQPQQQPYPTAAQPSDGGVGALAAARSYALHCPDKGKEKEAEYMKYGLAPYGTPALMPADTPAVVPAQVPAGSGSGKGSGKKRKEPEDAAQRKYRCQECDQRFARPSALATHILTHTKEKPFVCHTCQRGFAVMSNLRRHCRVRNHTLAPSQEVNERYSTVSSPSGSGGSSGAGTYESKPSVLVAMPALEPVAEGTAKEG
ncbi:hypothetical protein JCM10213v2_002242 [Rhodosporidiobolus nylandii]